LEHRFIQEQLSHKALEPVDLKVQLPALVIVLNVAQSESLSSTIVSRLGNALLTAKVRDNQSVY
jgi:hypothetical protein